MTGFTAVNLSDLPAPDVVEDIAFEDILADMKAALSAAAPDLASSLALESEPITKLLEVAAYREVVLRQRVNDAARAVLLAYAVGSDLEHLAALYGVKRETIDPGDPSAVPPVPPTMEGDEALRRRVQLAPEALTTAGSEGSYIFNGLSAGDTPYSVSVETPEAGTVIVTYKFDPAGFGAKVKDVSAETPSPGQVTVNVLAWAGDGTPDQQLLDQVTAHLSGDNVRPLTDQVTVQAATIQNYTIAATLELNPGPDASVIEAEALLRAQKYADDQHRLGAVVARSGIDAALHIGGVRKVTIAEPMDDIEPGPDTAAYCTDVTLTVTGAA